jgi:hypothetical protein
MGSAKALVKWRIASGTFTMLRRRWEKAGLIPPADDVKRSSARTLPRLPDWSDSMSEQVKLEWLKIWLFLYISIETKGALNAEPSC